MQIISRGISADSGVSALMAGIDWRRITVRQEWCWLYGDGGRRPESNLSPL